MENKTLKETIYEALENGTPEEILRQNLSKVFEEALSKAKTEIKKENNIAEARMEAAEALTKYFNLTGIFGKKEEIEAEVIEDALLEMEKESADILRLIHLSH